MSNDFLFIPSRNRFEKVWLGSIVYLGMVNDMIEVNTDDGKIITEATIVQLSKYLPSNRFCQVHESYMVSLDKILYFDDHEIHMPGAILPVQRKYRATLIRSITILSASTEAWKFKTQLYVDVTGRLGAV